MVNASCGEKLDFIEFVPYYVLMFFNFYELEAQIESHNAQILERLAKDFSYFKISSILSTPFLVLRIHFTIPPWNLAPRDWKPSKNCRFADKQGKRFLNYDDKVLGVVDFTQEQADFYGEDLNLLHEMTYLYFLSRIAKKLEQKSFFKIHACALSDEFGAILCPMLMKGGKTTLFLGLLSQRNFEILSDDAPLVSSNGDIFPFAVRVGMEKVESYSCFLSQDIYILERRRFGKKYLVDIASFKNKVATQKNSISIWKCRRQNQPGCQIEKTSKFMLFPLIFINMILGLGLPYAREFYLEGTWEDFLRLIKIGWGRSKAAFRLLRKADCYSVVLGNIPLENAHYLANFRSNNRR